MPPKRGVSVLNQNEDLRPPPKIPRDNHRKALTKPHTPPHLLPVRDAISEEDEAAGPDASSDLSGEVDVTHLYRGRTTAASPTLAPTDPPALVVAASSSTLESPERIQSASSRDGVENVPGTPCAPLGPPVLLVGKGKAPIRDPQPAGSSVRPNLIPVPNVHAGASGAQTPAPPTGGGRPRPVVSIAAGPPSLARVASDRAQYNPRSGIAGAAEPAAGEERVRSNRHPAVTPVVAVGVAATRDPGDLAGVVVTPMAVVARTPTVTAPAVVRGAAAEIESESVRLH
ncbi:hypothetical protein E1B28_002277 [Marasmius oreades]|uniref:Uncharacterized protein n=1 Tax=Marasmius oreades TaxID=181124 RepID=A0A9P7UL52_9AGAR|nr:uncharacterized protein E1B28_002277 [Marasmius oreades]KAG7086313.1 hypothetical protein E1B28_002277 [Marasmius oreades]